MEKINILDARNNLSRLVAAAGRGEEVIIAKRGVPVARLVPVDADLPPEHRAAQVSDWLATHLVPVHASRTATELEDQIASEREGWE